jgi:hypothetical protein
MLTRYALAAVLALAAIPAKAEVFTMTFDNEKTPGAHSYSEGPINAFYGHPNTLVSAFNYARIENVDSLYSSTIIFTMGGAAFDPVGFDVSGPTVSYPNEDLIRIAPSSPFANVYLLGYRAGAVVTDIEFTATAAMARYSLDGSFSNIDKLVIAALSPPAPAVCTIVGYCGQVRIDNVSLSSPTVFAAAVPEPSTWAMLLLGFAGLGLLSRRRLACPIRRA